MSEHHEGHRLSVEVEREGSTSTIRLAGELDLASAPLFQGVLEGERASAELAFIDLRDLSFVDSTGIKALVQAKREADAGGPKLLMSRPTGEVARLIELTGLHAVLPYAIEPG